MDWCTIYKHAKPQDFGRLIANPDEWQIVFARIIQQEVGKGSVLEAGCGFGVTSLLVGNEAQRTLMDLEQRAITDAQAVFAVAGQNANFIVGDLFSMNFPDDTFDVVFNAGVMEHFNEVERRNALDEIGRVVKPGGLIYLAVPNHFSKPYGFAYKYKKKRGKWPYPDEYPIFDFSGELTTLNNLKAIERITICKNSSFHFLNKFQRMWFYFLGLFQDFEGYLTVIKIKKLETN